MAKLAVTRWSILFIFLCSLALHAQTVTTFEGIDASQLQRPELDIDPNGAIGTKQYMEWTNVSYQAWSKSSPFTAVWPAPQAGITPFKNNGLTNCTSINGDGIVTFDRLASRWIIAAHNALTQSITSYYYCVAVSSTDDLTSKSLQWYTYAFPLNSILGTNSHGVTYFPDWPKFGTWPDAYYLGVDLQDVSDSYQEVGVVACAFDRADMLIGATALPPQCFRYPSTITDSLFLGHSLQPADVDGTTAPPAGSPEYFASIENPTADGVTTISDTFNLWQLHVDWSNTANSTFTQSTVSVPTYTPGCYDVKLPVETVCVPEPSTGATGQSIDSVGDRFMYRFVYRNFGTYQSYLASHAVQVGTGTFSQTGIRWYELRGDGVPELFQSGTITPDQSLYRFMPSMAQDQNANAAVGYSVSSASTHPGISASWWNLVEQTAPIELSLYSGTGDEENSYHWGDYTSMTVDPTDGCTFWYVNEYFAANQTGTSKPIWQTRISNFAAPTCGGVNLSPSSLAFNSQAIGTASASQQVILNNGEGTSLTINSFSFGGANPGDYTQNNDCGSSVAAGASCTINVSFAPTAAGSRTATLNVSDSATNSPQTVNLTGLGVAPVTLSSASLSFGTVLVESSKTAPGVTLTNQMNVALTGITVTITGSSAFTQVNTCGSSLAAGGHCVITVTFMPTAAGVQTGTVNITDSAGNSPQTIALKGTGELPVVVNPVTLAFGTVKVGTTSAAKTVTITNEMKTTLTITSIVLTSTDAGDYTMSANTCGSNLTAGAKCTVSVTFTPTAKGARPATLSITDGATTSPQDVNLTGTGD